MEPVSAAQRQHQRATCPCILGKLPTRSFDRPTGNDGFPTLLPNQYVWLQHLLKESRSE